MASVRSKDSISCIVILLASKPSLAADLGIKGTSDYVRVSELKKQAVQKLIDTVDHSQVLDYL